MFKNLMLHLCYRKVTDCDLCYGLFSFVFGMLRITVRILTKMIFMCIKVCVVKSLVRALRALLKFLSV